MDGLTGATDGERVTAGVPDVMLPCDGCGDLLRFLTRFRGRLLCRACIGAEATARGRQ